ncbi:MAG: hypothetical protein PF904_01220 [Kiritimatiellae bacterium]|nr:hypothetical protein [Kiritimatiellia bacterium]
MIYGNSASSSSKQADLGCITTIRLRSWLAESVETLRIKGYEQSCFNLEVLGVMGGGRI